MNPYKFKTGLLGQTGFNLKLFLVIVSILSLVSYGIFNARNMLLGPSIEIFNPTAKEIETKENTIVIKGRVQNMVSLSLNERPIFVDTEGFFEEKLLLSPWFNTIELKARDRFKKEAQETIKVYYKQGTTTEE